MRTVFYKISSAKFPRKMRLAVVADLHGGDPRRVVAELEKASPDYIILAGDILEALDGSKDAKNERAFPILKKCAEIAPTFYSTGNHEDGGVHSGTRKWNKSLEKERNYTDENVKKIESTGVCFLVNSAMQADGILFGGLASGIICKDAVPDIDFLKDFSKNEAPKILVCHHPEYYDKYIKGLDVDLVISGHAHGGQWRIFGRGIYSPGQGLFPKYTSGVYDGRLVVTTGLKKGFLPRFFNPREIVIIDI